MPFRAPVDDIRYSLEGAGEIASLSALAAFSHADPESLTAILSGAAALADGVLAPLNAPGDREGVRLGPDGVQAAAGFAEAWSAYAAGGWQGLAAPDKFGGQALPRTVAVAVLEMINAANMSFGLAPLLSLGAIEALAAHGSVEQQARYLPKLVSGAWTGAMNLTEPQAGSDVGALTAHAVPIGDGRYRIHGQKIFITWGEHDMAENVVHLVLARLPDAPAGGRGVSLFVTTRYRLDADLRPAEPNGVRCIGLERKMGIHASPTCVMAFDGAEAELIGAPHEGLACMFTMMNSARLNVGVQGVAIAEAAFQKALSYALERRQGRAEGAAGPGPSPIAAHPDIRRKLLTMRARIQAGRALCFATASAADRALAASSEAEARSATLREDLLTPIAKAWCADLGVDVASMGVQIHGGLGYAEDGGAAQYYRDARIAPIYEGTNGIQAIDLVSRKLGRDDGQAMWTLIDEARDCARSFEAADAYADQRIGHRLEEALESLAQATAYMVQALKRSRNDALAGATPYLGLAGEVIGGFLMARALARMRLRPDSQPGMLARQAALLGVFAETCLAQVPGRLAAITIGADAWSDPMFDAAT